MSYWTFNGKCGLAGVNGTYETLNGSCGARVLFHPDETNPAVLSDTAIISALQTSRVARSEFRRIFPTLLPEEQDRLNTLLESNPYVSQLFESPQTEADAIQNKDITSTPVRTSGRKGGILYRRTPL